MWLFAHTRWCLSVSQDLLDNERVRWQLNAGLNMMNGAIDAGGAPPPGTYPAAAEPAGYGGGYGAAPGAGAGGASSRWADAGGGTAAEDLTLRQLVERFAEENNVTFLPKVGSVCLSICLSAMVGFMCLSVCWSVRRRFCTCACLSVYLAPS
jgi:hypothetical protein